MQKVCDFWAFFSLFQTKLSSVPFLHWVLFSFNSCGNKDKDIPASACVSYKQCHLYSLEIYTRAKNNYTYAKKKNRTT